MDPVSEYIRIHVAGGFDGLEEIVENTVLDLAGRAPDERLRTEPEALARRLLAEHLEAQKRWPMTTDCDRLDAAFAELERAGIAARHHYLTYRDTARDEIEAEIDELKEQGRKVQGYVFYTRLDTSEAVESGRLELTFGPTQEAASRIRQALERAGLNTEWDGDADSPIVVKLDWKRRRA
jgi:hypothetical protein